MCFFETGNAQNSSDISQNFGADPGFSFYNNSTVNSIALQNDGKIIVGGIFYLYNGATEFRIIRLNTDGTRDTSFNIGSGIDIYDVKAIAVQSDGKIILGGNLVSYNSSNRAENNIIRLNEDGSKDYSFNVAIDGFGGGVNSIVIQSDGKIIVGGAFGTFNQLYNPGIIRLNQDGSKDFNFNVGSGVSSVFYNPTVNTIAIQPNGKIIIGGAFNEYNGFQNNNIVRLNVDGSIDSSFLTGSGFYAPVNSIVVQNDGKIIVGGEFSTFNSLLANKVVRLNTNGSKDVSFNPNSINYSIKKIAIQADGKIMVGGGITNMFTSTEKKINRLNIDGSIDSNFNSIVGFDNFVNSIEIQNDGKLVIGGWFLKYDDVSVNRIIRLNIDGGKDDNFNSATGFDNLVTTIAIQENGKITVGGEFTTYKGKQERGIIRLNDDSTKDNFFNTGIGFDSNVLSIVVQPDGKTIVGGDFTKYNGINQNKITRLNIDGSIDNSFITGIGFAEGGVYSIILQNDGKIIVGGQFGRYKGLIENRIIRLNPDGTKDSTFNAGTGFSNGRVNSIKVQNDGKILVGGGFSFYNGVTNNSIIRLNTDGSKDTTFATGVGINGSVLSIAIQNNGKILIGGSFYNYQDIRASYLIRLNSDATIDLTFHIDSDINSWVSTIAIQNNGKIIIGGQFQSKIAEINSDGTINNSFNVGVGFDNNVYSAAIKSDGRVYIAGYFTKYKNVTNSSRLITLNGNSTVLSNESIAKIQEISLFPIPTQNVLNILSPYDKIVNVRIYDLQGKIINEYKTTTIDVQDLAVGMYLIKIKTENNEYTKKFIKDKY